MVYFVSGIDTDTGKTIVTGLLAKAFQNKGIRVITQKMIQTGCSGVSEDVVKHREIMGMDLLEIDRNGTTCPYILSYPASPHLAAEIDGVSIDIDTIRNATHTLEQTYELILLEGAGGLFVPINRSYYTIDYITDQKLPLILVTSPKLGSINHTLMSLELCRRRNIQLVYLVYNCYPNTSDIIQNDSLTVFRQYLDCYFPSCSILIVPELSSLKDVSDWSIL